MNIIEVNGVKLYVEDKGSGPTVVLVHGIPTDYRVWRALAEDLSSYRVLNYSRRCAFPNKYCDYSFSTIENNVKDLEQLITGRGKEPVHLIGHSYGGPVAALCALRKPELVRSLVLIEPYLPGVIVNQKSVIDSLRLLVTQPLLAWSGLTSLGNIKTTLQAVSVNRGRKALDRYYSDTWKGRKVKVPLSSTARTMMLENMETFKELLNEVPIFTRQDAASVVQPTLIVTGEHTIRYMKAVALELNRIIPHNEMAVIRNAAHYPHLENPRECNAIISKFLSQNTDIV